MRVLKSIMREVTTKVLVEVLALAVVDEDPDGGDKEEDGGACRTGEHRVGVWRDS